MYLLLHYTVIIKCDMKVQHYFREKFICYSYRHEPLKASSSNIKFHEVQGIKKTPRGAGEARGQKHSDPR